MTTDSDLHALLREQGFLIMDLRERIAELETTLDDVYAKNQRLEARVLELANENHVLRGTISRYDAIDDDTK